MKVLALLLLALSVGVPGWGQKDPCPGPVSRLEFEKGTYSSQPGVVFDLRHFNGQLVPRGRRSPLCYEKLTEMAHGEIFVTAESLTRVFTTKLDRDAQTHVRDLKVESGAGTVKLSGEVVKVIPIKFSIEGPVTTDGTSLLLNAKKIDADGIPIKPLLAMIGDHLSSVMRVNGMGGGVSVNENTILFAPEKIAHLRGHIASVEATPEGLTLRYGPRERAAGKPGTRAAE